MKCSRRPVIATFPAAAFLGLTGLHKAKADAATPIIPLPEADRTQLDRLLGKGVVGEALPHNPGVHLET